MAKYDYEFKLKVVMSYLNGEGGYASVAKHYGVSHDVLVIRWVNAYKSLGKDGLKRKNKHACYPIQFKLDVLNYMIKNNYSEQETANHFGLNNPPLIATWKYKFLNGGIDALEKSKGILLMTKNKVENKLLTREQELEHENQLLKAELAFLKKLHALGMNVPERLKTDTKQK
jgi:transposase